MINDMLIFFFYLPLTWNKIRGKNNLLKPTKYLNLGFCDPMDFAPSLFETFNTAHHPPSDIVYLGSTY